MKKLPVDYLALIRGKNNAMRRQLNSFINAWPTYMMKDDKGNDVEVFHGRHFLRERGSRVFGGYPAIKHPVVIALANHDRSDEVAKYKKCKEEVETAFGPVIVKGPKGTSYDKTSERATKVTNECGSTKSILEEYVKDKGIPKYITTITVGPYIQGILDKETLTPEDIRELRKVTYTIAPGYDVAKLLGMAESMEKQSMKGVSSISIYLDPHKEYLPLDDKTDDVEDVDFKVLNVLNVFNEYISTFKKTKTTTIKGVSGADKVTEVSWYEVPCTIKIRKKYETTNVIPENLLSFDTPSTNTVEWYKELKTKYESLKTTHIISGDALSMLAPMTNLPVTGISVLGGVDQDTGDDWVKYYKYVPVKFTVKFDKLLTVKDDLIVKALAEIKKAEELIAKRLAPNTLLGEAADSIFYAWSFPAAVYNSSFTVDYVPSTEEGVDPTYRSLSLITAANTTPEEWWLWDKKDDWPGKYYSDGLLRSKGTPRLKAEVIKTSKYLTLRQRLRLIFGTVKGDYNGLIAVFVNEKEPSGLDKVIGALIIVVAIVATAVFCQACMAGTLEAAALFVTVVTITVSITAMVLQSTGNLGVATVLAQHLKNLSPLTTIAALYLIYLGIADFVSSIQQGLNSTAANMLSQEIIAGSLDAAMMTVEDYVQNRLVEVLITHIKNVVVNAITSAFSVTEFSFHAAVRYLNFAADIIKTQMQNEAKRLAQKAANINEKSREIDNKIRQATEGKNSDLLHEYINSYTNMLNNERSDYHYDTPYEPEFGTLSSGNVCRTSVHALMGDGAVTFFNTLVYN
jgi:hypothetical protein